MDSPPAARPNRMRGETTVEDIARELDEVRDEMIDLLHEYPFASDRDRGVIYDRCELLGGEIQELVGLLKLAIRHTNAEMDAEDRRDPEYQEEVSRLSRESLNAIHLAGQEVAAAITLLRETRTVDEGEEAV